MLYAKTEKILHNYNIDIFIRNIDEITQLITNNTYKIENGFYHQVFICDNDFVKILEKNEIKNCIKVENL